MLGRAVLPLRAVLLCLLGVLAMLPGCASGRAARTVAGAEGRMRRVKIDGNKDLPDRTIVEHLHLQPTQWFPLPKPRWFFPGYVAVDAQRVEDLYAAHGHYDAEVTDVQVKKHHKGKVVDLRFVVEEGEPTIVHDVAFSWPDGPPAGPIDRRARPEKIITNCNLEEGGTFSVTELQNSEAAMREALRARGYAFAQVVGTAEVDRMARTARVGFELRPGPWLRFGRITLEGVHLVREALVHVEVEAYEGKPYSPARVKAMEQAVYDLSIFSAVTATLADEPRGDQIDVTIRVTETEPQTVRIGVGLGIAPNRWEQYGEIRYRHENLFHNLTRFQAKLRAGYAELPALYSPREHGPILDFEPSLQRKGFLERKLVWTLAPKFEVGIQEGYQFYSPSYRAGVSRFFTRWVELGLSHNLRFVDFFNVADTLDEQQSLLGMDYRDPYLLSYVELEGWLHLTDRVVDPHDGVRLGGTYDLAGGIFGGQFDYQKITPELRAYWTPVRDRLQFALRAQTGFILTFGDEPGAPFDLKYYLGGPNTMRGFGWRRLSPYVRGCDPGQSCRGIPVGGETMVSGSFETRVRVWRDLWTVAFVDMGDVRDGRLQYRPQEWNWAIGPGLRYRSRIGTFRLDVGFLVHRATPFAQEPIWALHLGLGEAF